MKFVLHQSTANMRQKDSRCIVLFFCVLANSENFRYLYCSVCHINLPNQLIYLFDKNFVFTFSFFNNFFPEKSCHLAQTLDKSFFLTMFSSVIV